MLVGFKDTAGSRALPKNETGFNGGFGYTASLVWLRSSSAGVAVGAVYLGQVADVDWMLEVLYWRGGYVGGAVGF